jgi:hypothetical protein
MRAKLGELFSYTEAVAAGVGRRRLYALRDEGILTVVGAGLYRFSDAPPADLDLIEIAAECPPTTLRPETALARHGLVDAIPAVTGRNSARLLLALTGHFPGAAAPLRAALGVLL